MALSFKGNFICLAGLFWSRFYYRTTLWSRFLFCAKALTDIVEPDIPNLPHVDRSNVMEQPERDLPVASHLDTGTTPHGANIKSVEQTKMNSNSSETRANLRLHITGLFMRFTSEATEQAALQLQRDYAKRMLAKKSADYEKALVVQIEFPSAAESTRESKEQAQKEFDRMEEELAKKREASLKLAEEIAEHVIPVEEPRKLDDPSVTGKMKELDEKLAQYREEWEVLKNSQLQLDQRLSTLLTEENARAMTAQIQNEMGSVRQEFSACASRVSNLEAEIEQYRQAQGQVELESRINELSSKVDGLQEQRKQNDIVDLKDSINELSSRLDSLQEQHKDGDDNAGSQNALDSLSSRVDGLEAVKLEHSRAFEGIKSDLELQSSVINDRTEISILYNEIKTFSRSEDEIRGAVTKLQSQIRSLEKELRNDRLKMGGIDRRRPSVGSGPLPLHSNVPDTSGLSHELRLAIHDEIKEQQAAVDGVLSEKLEGIEGRLSDLARLYSDMDGSLTTSRAQYTIGVDQVAIDLLSVKADLANVRSDISSVREEVNSLRQHEIQSLQLALNNLDYRMNNLSTEYLARQILSQLEAHMRGTKENYATLELRLQELEKRAAKGEISALSNSLKSEIKGQINTFGEQIRKNFIETNTPLVSEMNTLRTELASITSDLRKVQGDLESSKTHILEVTNSLKTEVDTINSTSQGMRNDISASKHGFMASTESLRDEVNRVGLTLQSLQDDLSASKVTCKEATASLKAELAKAAKTVPPEKRKLGSSAVVKTNGHTKRSRSDGRPRPTDLDSEEDA